MTTWTILLLIIIIGPWLFDLIVEHLNVKHAKPNLPDELKDVYDEEKYKQSQDYLKAGTHFGTVSSTITTVITLAFIFLGGFKLLDDFVRQFSDNVYILGLLFIGVFSIASSIIEIPLAYYRNFVIEEKFGFNKMTVGLFIKDNIRDLILSVVIGTPIMLVLMWVFQLADQHSFAWLYAWTIVTLFMAIMYYVTPVWILPLYNKFEAIEDGELKTSIMDYAKKENFALQGVYKTDGSKRSTKGNAYFIGFGKTRRIVLFDTLIEKHSVGELTIVLAHEMGHFKLKHVIKQMAVMILYLGTMLFMIQLLMTNKEVNLGIYEAFQMGDSPNVSVYASMIFTMMIISPLNLVFSIIRNFFSRKHEFEADAYAAETCGNPQDLITALKNLSSENLSNLTPHPLKVFLEYSHPTVYHRILALKKFIK